VTSGGSAPALTADAAGSSDGENATNANTGPGGLLLHEDVIKRIGNENGSAIARLVELARVSVIELGDGQQCLRCVDAAMAACPAEQHDELHALLWVEGLGCFYSGEWSRGAKHFEVGVVCLSVCVAILT
jgi:hypothetical protein